MAMQAYVVINVEPGKINGMLKALKIHRISGVKRTRTHVTLE